MSVINTNLNSLIAQNALSQNNAAENTSLQRLSTGLQINSGADNPSGLIAANNFKAEQNGIQTAISNASLASNVVGTADGALSEVSSMLTQLQGLVSQAANTGALSSNQVSADQLQVDSILSTINSIANNTNFQGAKILNGDLAYTTSSTSNVNNLQVNTASVYGGVTQKVVVNVTQSAQTAHVGFNTDLPLGSAVTIQITGDQGSQQLSFATGTTEAQLATAINTVKSQTGVSASASGGALRLDSTDFGSAAFVTVSTISGTGFGSASASGRDAKVQINGATANVTGTNVSYSSAGLDLSFALTTALNTANGTTTFGITGGGANFQFGETVTNSGIVSIGLQSMNTGTLGNSTDGELASLGSGGANDLSSANLTSAQKILNDAITQVSTLQGRLGAFQDYTIGSTVNSLSVAYENATSALSNIEDTNFASETSNLTRDQILASSAETVLATANSEPQNALKLLQNI
jgi:flagellin